MVTALTIAGSDSGGGAGIQADLKTFAAHGVYGTSAITALTAQNTTGVTGVHVVPPEFVVAQIDAIADDIPIGAAKTGMLATAPTVRAVADVIARRRLPWLVVDPVMVAKSGDSTPGRKRGSRSDKRADSAGVRRDAEPHGGGSAYRPPSRFR